jgi:hypothetical protein
VRRVYVGPDDEVTRLAAEMDQQRRARREADRADWLDYLQQLQAVDERLTDLKNSLGALAKACLLLGGYHQHGRSHWRRRAGSGP